MALTMGKIHRLPDDLANQIAAGEVVERPASVIKELVENAIDAGARRLTITVEYGGKKLIRVEDDGEGMAPDDARLAIERHATSKIWRAEDLERIGTLGFRGEALPSIASVSHFTLRTRARGATSGTEIRINGGAVAAVVEVGMAEGTCIEVADLFYNLPARRKFLKSDAAESAQVSKIVAQLALCYPEIGFALTSAGRRVLQCPPVSTLRDRLYQLHGDRNDLVEVRRDSGDITVLGYIAALAEQGPSGGAQGGPTRGPQNIFINRRVVKDRTIASAIITAYSVASIKERSPEVHLFIQMPHDAIDVNVHPTKAEVRFRDQGHVHEVIRRTLGDALGRSGVPVLELTPPISRPLLPTTPSLPGAYSGFYPSRWNRGTHGSSGSAGSWGGGSGSAGSPASGESLERARAPHEPAPHAPLEPMEPSEPSEPLLRPLMPLGQFRDTFIVAVDEEGIAIIDQHVAHERVLFERVIERLTSGRLESQRLLVPILVELAPSGRQALVAHAVDLERLGFELEEFGGDAVRIGAIPALLGREECEAAVRALAEDLEGLDRGSRVEEAIKRIAATIACHAAVKANDPLTPEKMLHILDELRRTAYSTICPHGRPVMLRLTRREIEKNFQRI
jgi:DNA mismatch repair protein MutL